MPNYLNKTNAVAVYNHIHNQIFLNQYFMEIYCGYYFFQTEVMNQFLHIVRFLKSGNNIKDLNERNLCVTATFCKFGRLVPNVNQTNAIVVIITATTRDFPTSIYMENRIVLFLN
jgi:hypothetical protein